jgi:hypothetical protein
LAVIYSTIENQKSKIEMEIIEQESEEADIISNDTTDIGEKEVE